MHFSNTQKESEEIVVRRVVRRLERYFSERELRVREKLELAAQEAQFQNDGLDGATLITTPGNSSRVSNAESIGEIEKKSIDAKNNSILNEVSADISKPVPLKVRLPQPPRTKVTSPENSENTPPPLAILKSERVIKPAELSEEPRELGTTHSSSSSVSSSSLPMSPTRNPGNHNRSARLSGLRDVQVPEPLPTLSASIHDELASNSSVFDTNSRAPSNKGPTKTKPTGQNNVPPSEVPMSQIGFEAIGPIQSTLFGMRPAFVIALLFILASSLMFYFLFGGDDFSH